MRKELEKLSKAERQKVEREYHRMQPEDFDQLMTDAERHVTSEPRQKQKNKATEKSAPREP
jgi:hypothetical protein